VCDLFLWCLTTATGEQLVLTISHAQLKNIRQAANPLTRIEAFSPEKRPLERPSYGISSRENGGTGAKRLSLLSLYAG
jgi:hypothetical protein